MLIVLDTNALHRDYFLTKPSAVALAREQGRGAFSVVVPEVVVREHIKHFLQERGELTAAMAQYSGVTTNEIGPSLLQPPTETYPDHLRARLAELSVRVAPYPAVSHAAIVERAIGGRLPFFGDGQQGYHDVLIWETSVELCRAEPVVLVSKDRRAFGSETLHSELVDELARLGLAGRVMLANSIPAFLDQYVSPLLERLVALERDMNEGAAAVNPREWLMRELAGRKVIDHMLSEWFQPEEFVETRTEYRQGVRHSLSGSWRHTTDLKRTVASNARRLANGDVLVKLDIELAGEASYDDTVSENGVLYESSSWEQPHGVRAELQLLVTDEGKKIEDAEVEYAELSD